MLNQQALDSLYSATYLEDYLDCMENLPGDIQRYISRMRDLDINYSAEMDDLEETLESFITNYKAPVTMKTEPSVEALKQPEMKAAMKFKLQTAQKNLMKAQDIGDDKLQLAQNIQDNVENKSRQLELDKKNLGELTKLRPREYGREMENQENTKEYTAPERGIKRQRRAKHEVFVPSILGPSTLEVTSFVDSAHDVKHESVTSTTKSHQPPASQSSATTAVSAASASSTYIKQEPKAGTSGQSEDVKLFARVGDRASASSTRAGGGDRGEPDLPAQGRTSERASNAGNSSFTAVKKPKKEPQQNVEKKYKRRKAKQARNNDASPPDPIDPDEPTYCLCDQVSYGEMIGCDNDLCPIEWFHFTCVTLVNKPKGKWYCPKCRADKPNIMKSKALFLKELEKYNREKEEKA